MEGGKVGTPSSPVSQSPPPGKPGSVVLPPALSPPSPSAEPSGTPPQTGAMKERRTSAELRRGTEVPRSLSSPELLSELKTGKQLRRIPRSSGLTTVFSGRGRAGHRLSSE